MLNIAISLLFFFIVYQLSGYKSEEKLRMNLQNLYNFCTQRMYSIYLRDLSNFRISYILSSLIVIIPYLFFH